MKERVDASKIPHASRTSVAWDPESNEFVLLLEDAEGKAFAALKGCIHCWLSLFSDMTAVMANPGNDNEETTIQ